MIARGIWFGVLGAGLLLGLAAAPVRGVLESAMTGQMLIQMPLLVLAGILGARAMPDRWTRAAAAWNGGGLAGLLLASFVASYWMLPRALDAALASASTEVAKFLSLPFLLGLPLALSWPRLHPIAKGFFVANLISMLAVLGWLYREAPVRLCNYYLLDQQIITGDALIATAVACTGAWFVVALVGSRSGSKPTADSAEETSAPQMRRGAASQAS